MRRIFGSSSAMRTIGTYVVRSRAGVPVGALWRASDADFPSERSFVVNRCPSEIRSTSSATESIACSIRSSLATTSLGICGFLDSASRRREYARARGTPTARTIAVTNAPSGTATSGPISRLPLGVDAVCRYSELNLCSFPQRARRVHSSIVRPNCLARDCQPQPSSTRLVRDIRLPDRLQLFRGDTLAVVRDSDPDRTLTARRNRAGAHGDTAVLSRRVDCVEQNIAQSPCKGAVMAVHSGKIVVYLQIEGNGWRHAASRSISNELTHVDFRGRSFGEPSELGEAPGHSVEAIRFNSNHPDVFLQVLRSLPAQPGKREANRRQRILDFVRDSSRTLSESVQSLSLDGLPPPVLKLGDHLAHTSAPRLEFGGATNPARGDVDGRSIIPVLPS